MDTAIDRYAAEIALGSPWSPPSAAPGSDDRAYEATVASLVRFFAEESRIAVPTGHAPITVLRALLTRRPAGAPIPDAVQDRLDRVLQQLRDRNVVQQALTLPTIAERMRHSRYPAADRTSLWRGDITHLAADAIVNAANAQMLGCFIPFHACIDNAIHWAAGPRLRADCDRIMCGQGHEEATGTAKVTRAYNLPSRFVLHTVGPIVRGELRPSDCYALASCYRACLDLTSQLPGIQSVAFCSISTGVFGFPKREAARVALDTVAEWLAKAARPPMRVVFNVFGGEDESVYLDALGDIR